MRSLRKITAIKLFALGCLALAGLIGQAHAQVAGKVLNISGPLFAVKADSSRRVLSVGSNVDSGDTLLTEARTYARVKFSDGSEVTLRPGSQFKVDSYRFEQGAPSEDQASFNLLKGAMRTVTGLIGKRGNQEAYRLNTPTATIGIRGTRFVVEYIPGPSGETPVTYYRPLPIQLAAATGDRQSDVPAALFQLAQATPSASSPMPGSFGQGGAGLGGGTPGLPPTQRPPGTYLLVEDGLVSMSTNGGSANFGAGQSGFSGSNEQQPTMLPGPANIPFSAPPEMNDSSPQGNAPTTGDSSPSGAGECEVR